jgi:hypothetical protein
VLKIENQAIRGCAADGCEACFMALEFIHNPKK